MFTLRRRPRAPKPLAPTESLSDLVPSWAACSAASQLGSLAYVESTRHSRPSHGWSRDVAAAGRSILVASAHLGEPGLDPADVEGLIDRDLAPGVAVLARTHALGLGPSSAVVALVAVSDRSATEREAARLLDDLAAGAPKEWALRRLEALR